MATLLFSLAPSPPFTGNGTSSSLRLSSHFISRPQVMNNKTNNENDDNEVYQKAKSTTTMASVAETPTYPPLFNSLSCHLRACAVHISICGFVL